MYYTHRIIELYPDGGKWTHYARCYEDAIDLANQLVEAHPARKTVIEHIEEDES